MKTLIWIVGIAIIIFVIYQFWPDGELEAGESAKREGEVVSVDTTSVASDGPVLVTISSNGNQQVIAVPSFGINLCAASKNIADAFNIRQGETVSVRGTVNEQGQIVPCADESDYLRVK